MSELWIVDSFADAPFSGNPAAVCMLPGQRPDAWQQALAGEMNQAATAFLTRKAEDWGLRWFNPRVELELCGHGTLASAHFLWESGRLQRTTAARFHTRRGVVTAAPDGDWIVLDFPSTPPAEITLPKGLADALGARPVWSGRSPFDLLVQVDTAETVRSLSPDFAALAAFDARGIIVTAEGDSPDIDFVSRFFSPRVGVPEDPVTGSAHCALAPHWANRLGRTTLTGHQASSRGGKVRVEVQGERVQLAGKARTVVRGELLDK
ncbi:MAG TPA: PhzF family phenazine biosynthesis protein [Gemmatimonadales bacterium]|nr:PhzF family phenazine biosynthesis protein [Gemmatimonadales bacterium]